MEKNGKEVPRLVLDKTIKKYERPVIKVIPRGR